MAARALIVGALIGLGWVAWDRTSSTSLTTSPPGTMASSGRSEAALWTAAMTVTTDADRRCVTVTVEAEPPAVTCYRIANFQKSGGLFLLSELVSSDRSVRSYVMARLDSVDVVDATLDGDVAVRQIDHFVVLAGTEEDLPRTVITIKRDGIEARCRFEPGTPLPRMRCTR